MAIGQRLPVSDFRYCYRAVNWLRPVDPHKCCEPDGSRPGIFFFAHFFAFRTISRNTHSYTIYEKNSSVSPGAAVRYSPHHLQIADLGRCDYAFFLHIHRHYDCLADTTVFCKTNWKKEGLPFFNLLDYGRKYDFAEAGAVRRFLVYNASHQDPPGEVAEHLYTNTWENIRVVLPLYGRHDFVMDWVTEVFNSTTLPEPVRGWGFAPCFSVSRRLLRRHPRRLYRTFMEKFHPELQAESWDFRVVPLPERIDGITITEWTPSTKQIVIGKR